jgi:mannose-6-phosphate isomerase-like protein (cupin superfamily)
MRIAMLPPPLESSSPTIAHAGEEMVALLADGMIARGIEVTVFATSPWQAKAQRRAFTPHGSSATDGWEASLWDAVGICELFEHADDFELIHNHFGAVPLTYSLMTTTPVVTTIYGRPSAASLAIYQKYQQRGFYLATSDGDRLPELSYEATVPQGSTMVEDHLEIYRRVIEREKREDHRPWGYYRVLEDAVSHKVKRIVVYAGKRLSLQRHLRRAEHWYILEGAAIVTRDDEQLHLRPGQAVDLPQGCTHRVMNPGTGNMAFIEVQTGDYFGEDDIERIEDDFGRMP